MKHAIIILLFSWAFYCNAQSLDTLTLKDCRCVEYDAYYNVCDVVIFTGSGLYIGEWFIVRDFVTTFNFNGIWRTANDPRSIKAHPATTNFFGIKRASGTPQFGTMIFFTRKQKRA